MHLSKPTLEYCCSVWGNCSADALSQLTSAQKRAARILVNADYITPSLTLFQHLQIISIVDTIRHRILLQTFNSFHKISRNCPSTIVEKPTHHHSTRAIENNNLFLPKARSNAAKRRFSFLAPSLWNRFPDEGKKLTTTRGFRSFCKEHFKNKLAKMTELNTKRLY
jgi:hypothetical protein